MSAGTAIDAINRFAKATGAMSKSETREMAVVAEVAKEALRSAASNFVSDAEGMPLLSSRSCDGTPIRVVHRSTVQLHAARKEKSSGKKGMKFLVKNQFLRGKDVTGAWSTRVLLSEATPMVFGKTTGAILGACFKDWQSLREMGHVGCAVEHYVFDRLSIGALERLCRQRHQDQQLPELPSDVSPHVARLS